MSALRRGALWRLRRHRERIVAVSCLSASVHQEAYSAGPGGELLATYNELSD